MMFEPTLLTGTVMGVLLNIWLPEWTLLMMLILTLGYNSFITYVKGCQMKNKENQLRELALETGQTISALIDNQDEEIINDDIREVSPEDQFIIDRWDRQNRWMVPPYRFGMILAGFITLMIQATLRGQPTVPL